MAVSARPSHIRLGVSTFVVSAAPVTDRNREKRDWFTEEFWLMATQYFQNRKEYPSTNSNSLVRRSC